MSLLDHGLLAVYPVLERQLVPSRLQKLSLITDRQTSLTLKPIYEGDTDHGLPAIGVPPGSRRCAGIGSSSADLENRQDGFLHLEP